MDRIEFEVRRLPIQWSQVQKLGGYWRFAFVAAIKGEFKIKHEALLTRTKWILCLNVTRRSFTITLFFQKRSLPAFILAMGLVLEEGEAKRHHDTVNWWVYKMVWHLISLTQPVILFGKHSRIHPNVNLGSVDKALKDDSCVRVVEGLKGIDEST